MDRTINGRIKENARIFEVARKPATRKPDAEQRLSSPPLSCLLVRRETNERGELIFHDGGGMEGSLYFSLLTGATMAG